MTDLPKSESLTYIMPPLVTVTPAPFADPVGVLVPMSESLRQTAETRAKAMGFTDLTEYVRQVIRADLKKAYAIPKQETP